LSLSGFWEEYQYVIKTLGISRPNTQANAT